MCGVGGRVATAVVVIVVVVVIISRHDIDCILHSGRGVFMTVHIAHINPLRHHIKISDIKFFSVKQEQWDEV